MTRVAVVTDAITGPAFGIVKGLLKRFDGVVYLTSRDEGRGKAAVAKLNELGLTPEYHQLDVTDRDSVLRFREHIKDKYEGIDILINNTAGTKTVELNNSVQELLFPLITQTILNITSDCEQFTNVRLTMEDPQAEDINAFMDLFMEAIAEGDFTIEDIDDEGTSAFYRPSNVNVNANEHSLCVKIVYESVNQLITP